MSTRAFVIIVLIGSEGDDALENRTNLKRPFLPDVVTAGLTPRSVLVFRA